MSNTNHVPKVNGYCKHPFSHAWQPYWIESEKQFHVHWHLVRCYIVAGLIKFMQHLRAKNLCLHVLKSAFSPCVETLLRMLGGHIRLNRKIISRALTPSMVLTLWQVWSNSCNIYLLKPLSTGLQIRLFNRWWRPFYACLAAILDQIGKPFHVHWNPIKCL